MKKFLILLLISIIACEVVEEYNILREIALSLKDLYNYLYTHGFIKIIKDKLFSVGKKAAIKLCCTFTPTDDDCNKCTSIIGMIK